MTPTFVATRSRWPYRCVLPRSSRVTTVLPYPFRQPGTSPFAAVSLPAPVCQAGLPDRSPVVPPLMEKAGHSSPLERHDEFRSVCALGANVTLGCHLGEIESHRLPQRHGWRHLRHCQPIGQAQRALCTEARIYSRVDGGPGDQFRRYLGRVGHRLHHARPTLVEHDLGEAGRHGRRSIVGSKGRAGK